MAAVQRKSILEGTFGAGSDIASQIAQDTSLPAVGYQDPPPGIKKGVAQLDEVKFDEYKSGENEGKPYFSATAIICEPVKHVYTPTSKGQPIGDAVEVHTAGMQTRIQIPMYDVKAKSGKNMGQITTKEQQAMKVAQYLRALGADTSKVRKISDLEPLAETLTRIARNPKTPIYVNFRTSVRQSMNIGEADGSWQNWEGCDGLENYTPPGGDELPPEMTTNDTTTASAPATSTEPDLSGEGGNPHEQSSIEELVEGAQNGDDAAQTELLRRAAEATGQSAEEINEAAESWQGVADLVTAPDGSEPDAPEPPKKGDHVNYRPPVNGPKGPTPGKKVVECTVTMVNDKAQTVTLKNTVDGKTLYKDVAWASLEPVS
jgi:hypothetical protein